jgi:hypothetical protein
MAWVEAAVVFYLRSHIDRLVPYQPHPLPEIGDFAFAEIVRELATMAMLLSVGCLAGRTWRSRIAFTLLAFGVWDIAYYVWLVPLTGWPRSIFDWDILFLIPLPWWGPVWAPASIALLMIFFGTVVGIHDSEINPLWSGRLSWWMASVGTLLALYVFMSDSIRVVFVERSLAPLADLLPQRFNWPILLVALAFLSAPVANVIWKGATRRDTASCANAAETITAA